MERLASPGSVYLTEHTAKLVPGLFRLRDLGQFEVRGVRERLGVFELEGVGPLRTTIESARSRGFSRLVGRSGEMASLQGPLAKAIGGSGQVVGVVADAGVGKEPALHGVLRALPESWHSGLRSDGVSHGKAIAFLPILELFRAST